MGTLKVNPVRLGSESGISVQSAGVVPVEAGALQRIFAFVQRLKNTKGFKDEFASGLGLHPRPTVEKPAPGFQLSIVLGITTRHVTRIVMNTEATLVRV